MLGEANNCKKRAGACEPLIVVAAFVSNAEFNGQLLETSTSTTGPIC
jgi:hypothetical protein